MNQKYTPFQINFIIKHYNDSDGPRLCASELKIDINKLYHIAHRLGMFKKRIYSTINFNLNDPNFVYFLGYSWADGHLRRINKNGRLRFSFEILERDMREIKPILLSIGVTSFKTNKRKDRQMVECFYCNNQEFCEKLESLDFIIKSRVPPVKILKVLPDGMERYFLHGFFDGDGSITLPTNKSNFKCLSFSGPFAQEWGFLQDFCNRLDCTGYVKQLTSSTGSQSTFNLYNYDAILKFGNFIFNDKIRGLSRKIIKFQELKNRFNTY